MTLVTRRLKEKEQRRKAILKASQRLFSRKGYQAVSVEDIARKARISKGTVYLYFHSKEEIYAQILLNDIEVFHEKLFDIIDERGSAADMLLQFSDFYIDFFFFGLHNCNILICFHI